MNSSLLPLFPSYKIPFLPLSNFFSSLPSLNYRGSNSNLTPLVDIAQSSLLV